MRVMKKKTGTNDVSQTDSDNNVLDLTFTTSREG
jgi:hypothetical protein